MELEGAGIEEDSALEERKDRTTAAGQERQWKGKGGTEDVGGGEGGSGSWQMDVGLETGQEGTGAHL